MTDGFVRCGDVHAGAWSERSAASRCAECSHPHGRHAGKRGACGVAACGCRGFALWRGVPMDERVGEFEAVLARLGDAGERARALWALARPSALHAVSDMTRAEMKVAADDLVKLADVTLLSGVTGLAMLILWDETGSRLEWFASSEGGCVSAEFLRGLWSPRGDES